MQEDLKNLRSRASVKGSERCGNVLGGGSSHFPAFRVETYLEDHGT